MNIPLLLSFSIFEFMKMTGYINIGYIMPFAAAIRGAPL